MELGGISTADSSAIAAIGPTTVLATCTLEVTAPPGSTPHSGFLTVEFHFNPLSSPPSSSSLSSALFAYGRPTPLSAAFAHHLQALLTLHVLPLTSLSIAPSTHCWHLHVDLLPLSLTSPSSAYDAASLAALTALASLTLPHTTLSEEGEVLLVGGVGRRVEVGQWPVVTSFVLVGEKLLVDVDGEEEEQWAEAVVRVAVGDDGRVLDVWKAGGAGLDKAEMEEAIQRAKQRTADVLPIIKRLAHPPPAAVASNPPPHP